MPELQEVLCLSPGDPGEDRVIYASEKEFQATVVEMAQAYGWLVNGVFEQRHYAKRLSKGYPDLTMVRGKRLIVAELKSEKGKVSEDQLLWATALRGCAVEYYLWRPSDIEQIEELLR